MRKKRNIILAILFLTWTVCYMDRMVMTVAVPYIAKDFNLTPVAMGVVMSTFFAGYALFQIPGGMLADKFGARKIMSIAVSWWSVFTVFTGMAASLTHMLIIRFLFGVGEASFPGGSWKTIANWFPKKERASANSIMMSSNSLGPAIAPLFVVGIMAAYGWRSVFYFLFIPGIIVVLLIWFFIKDNPKDSKMISAEELKVIQDENFEKESTVDKVKFIDIIKLPVAWKLFFTWFTYDIVFWGFSSWIPSYLVNARGFQLLKMGIIASLPFFAGTVGVIVGGYVSDKYFVGKRRNLIVISEILTAIMLFLTYNTSGEGLAMTFLTLTGFFVCVAFGGFWALPMNILNPEVMGASSSFINFAGQIAGFISPIVMGILVQISGGSFGMAFVFLAIAVLVSACIAFTIREKKVEISKTIDI
ncbi:MFS transporter [Clostridium fermenticellae]|nr:MFS transporter [Clostridium fermenticellae]